MIGVIDILRNNANVGARVGGTGANARVYPVHRPQKEPLPAVTIATEDIEPSDTKSGVSALDRLEVRVISYASTYDIARLLAEDCRNAIDRVSGTFNGQQIQSIRFLDSFDDVEEIENSLVYFVEQNYNVRLIR